MEKTALKSRKFVRSSPVQVVRKRRKWTWEEDLKLRRGIAEYGVGNWSLIKSVYRFQYRTPIDLKV
jgi:hypothetical protein